MHIPDGYLDMHIALIFYILSFLVLTYSLRKIEIDESIVPKVGIVAAGIFAAQMLNWPIPFGTSAHFVGGGLAAIILGPYLASIAMASVLIIQTLIFGDGGITALGANIWNMAIVNVFVAYAVFKAFRGGFLGAFLAGWLGITAAAIFTGIEIGISSSFGYNISVTVPVMGVWHAILGIIEGLITALSYSYISKHSLPQKRVVGHET